MSFENLKPAWNRRKPLRRTPFKPAKGKTWKKLSPISKNKEKRAKRFVPRSIGKEVIKRSGGICEFVNHAGIRCVQYGSGFHHRKKKSQGGKHTLENLRHCCWHHNLWAETAEGKVLAPKLGWTIL